MEIFEQHISKLEEDTITLPAGPSGMAKHKAVMDKKFTLVTYLTCAYSRRFTKKRSSFSCIHQELTSE